jgi:hypothetical protein
LVILGIDKIRFTSFIFRRILKPSKYNSPPKTVSPFQKSLDFEKFGAFPHEEARLYQRVGARGAGRQDKFTRRELRELGENKWNFLRK